MTINDIPSDLIAALNSLAWSENGTLWGIRYEKDRMWNHSHIIPRNMAEHQGIIEEWSSGNYILKHDGAGIDPVPQKLPGIGQPVLQIHRSKGIVRTSRIKRIAFGGDFPILDIEPYGPAGGEPIGGDSGSIFLSRDKDGKPVVLGMAIYAGWLCFSRPHTTDQEPAMSEAESKAAMDALLGNTPVPQPPTNATNDERQYLLDKIAALEAMNAKQAALILRLRETFSELLKP